MSIRVLVTGSDASERTRFINSIIAALPETRFYLFHSSTLDLDNSKILTTWEQANPSGIALIQQLDTYWRGVMNTKIKRSAIRVHPQDADTVGYIDRLLVARFLLGSGNSGSGRLEECEYRLDELRKAVAEVLLAIDRAAVLGVCESITEED